MPSTILFSQSHTNRSRVHSERHRTSCTIIDKAFFTGKELSHRSLTQMVHREHMSIGCNHGGAIDIYLRRGSNITHAEHILGPDLRCLVNTECVESEATHRYLSNSHL